MSLSSDSDTINAVGIFGRLTPELEAYFASLQDRYSKVPKEHQIYSHLSLIVHKDVPVGKLPQHIDTLRELKPFLPLKLRTSGVIVKDELHLGLMFDIAQTEQIRNIATKFVPEGVVTTHYTKVVWFVPKENQEEAVKVLEKTQEMVFYDFILCANKQDNKSTIYSSNRYK